MITETLIIETFTTSTLIVGTFITETMITKHLSKGYKMSANDAALDRAGSLTHTRHPFQLNIECAPLKRDLEVKMDANGLMVKFGKVLNAGSVFIVV